MDKKDYPTKDQYLPESFGGMIIEPVALDEKRQDLARRLDELFLVNGRAERPSDWLKGAIFVSQDNLRTNSDWFAQAAHSLRDVLYRLLSPRMGGKKGALRQFLINYGSAQNLDISAEQMGRLFNQLSDIAHHGKRLDEAKEGDFETFLATFEKVMFEALERQLDIHKDIDNLLSQKPE